MQVESLRHSVLSGPYLTSQRASQVRVTVLYVQMLGTAAQSRSVRDSHERLHWPETAS